MMTSRQLSRPAYITPPMEIDYIALDAFQQDTIRAIASHADHINTLKREVQSMSSTLTGLRDLVNWIGLHKPEAIEAFNTTQRVINRLEDGNDLSEADMIQEMRITP